MGIELIPFTTGRRNPPQLVTIDRERLEALIASAIEMLDLIDGDPDLETYNTDEEDDDPDHCVAGDDGLHPLLIEGKVRWGSEFDDHDRAPDYGIDQTRPRFRLPEWMEDKRI